MTLVAGQHPAGIDIRMRRAAAYCARGEVRDPSGALVEQASLRLSMDDVGGSAGVITEGGPPATLLVGQPHAGTA